MERNDQSNDPKSSSGRYQRRSDKEDPETGRDQQRRMAFSLAKKIARIRHILFYSSHASRPIAATRMLSRPQASGPSGLPGSDRCHSQASGPEGERQQAYPTTAPDGSQDLRFRDKAISSGVA